MAAGDEAPKWRMWTVEPKTETYNARSYVQSIHILILILLHSWWYVLPWCGLRWWWWWSLTWHIFNILRFRKRQNNWVSFRHKALSNSIYLEDTFSEYKFKNHTRALGQWLFSSDGFDKRGMKNFKNIMTNKKKTHNNEKIWYIWGEQWYEMENAWKSMGALVVPELM